MTTEELKTRLTSTRSPERRSAAKAIGRSLVCDLGPDLAAAYQREALDKRTWETQVEMILALGRIGYTLALPSMEAIVRNNEPYSMITNAAAQSYVRLKRASNNDARPVIELLKFGRLSVVTGAPMPLAQDRMIPISTEIEELVALSYNLHKHKDRRGTKLGSQDPRYGVAIACAGWDKKLTEKFLTHCLATGDAVMRRVAESSLKGKYTF